MTVKKYNVVKPRKYVSKGEEKTTWDNVGTVTLFQKDDGTESGKLELVSFDKTIELNIFPFKEKSQTQQPRQTYRQAPREEIIEIPVEDEDIKVEDISF